MVSSMFGTLGTLAGKSARAWLGAAGLHVLAILALLPLSFKPLPPTSLEPVSIELVDAPLIEPAEPVEDDVEPEPLEPEPVAPIEPTPPEPEPAPEPVPEAAPEPPAPPPPALTTVAPPPAPEVLEDDDEEDEIPPQYLIRRDPFLEVAPSGAARVSASVMCARTNRETRPAFCPDIDDEDKRFALLARAQGDLGGYSPRDEVIFAGTTFDEYARQQGYETFRDRQERYRAIGATGGSPIVTQGVDVPRHAEGLENCTPVRTGIARVGGGTDGLTTELSNGSEVFCD